MSALSLCTCLSWYLWVLYRILWGIQTTGGQFYSRFCILDAGDNPFKSDGLDLRNMRARAGEVSQEGHTQPENSRSRDGPKD